MRGGLRIPWEFRPRGLLLSASTGRPVRPVGRFPIASWLAGGLWHSPPRKGRHGHVVSLRSRSERHGCPTSKDRQGGAILTKGGEAMSAIDQMLVVEPRTQAWLDELAAAGGPPLYELSPQDARGVLRSVQTSVTVVQPDADIDDRVIPGGPTGEVQIRIVKPKNVTGTLPIVFHTHGGGWILGDKDTHERMDRELA